MISNHCPLTSQHCEICLKLCKMADCGVDCYNQSFYEINSCSLSGNGLNVTEPKSSDLGWVMKKNFVIFFQNFVAVVLHFLYCIRIEQACETLTPNHTVDNMPNVSIYHVIISLIPIMFLTLLSITSIM